MGNCWLDVDIGISKHCILWTIAEDMSSLHIARLSP
jgi:hypothetical protein